MRDECRAAVVQAVGRSMSDAEFKDIEARLSRHMRQNAARDPGKALAMPVHQRMEEAATTAAQEFVAEASKKRQRVALGIIAAEKTRAHLASFPNKLDGLARTIAFHADARGGEMSIETRAKAIEADAIRQMLSVLEASNPKFFGYFENPAGIRAIVMELFGEDSGHAPARQGAAEFGKVTEALRQRFNSRGGDVGKLEDWGMPHHHSQRLVAKAGEEKWIADILPLLKRDRYVREDGSRMGEAEIREFLGHAYRSIATGGINKLTPGRAGGSGMRANRGNESRQIHFKDADSYLAYQTHYGERSLYEVIVGHISSVSKDIALVEQFGPNPDHAFRLFRDQALKEMTLANPAKAGSYQKQLVQVENLYNQVAGKTLPVASRLMAESFDTLRNWLVGSRLGSAVISSFSDESTMHLTAKVNGLPQMRLLANELAALNPADRDGRRRAMRAGLALNSYLSGLNRFGTGMLGTSWSSKLSNAVIRMSGLNALTEARREAWGVTQMHDLGHLVSTTKDLAALHASDRRILKTKGITDADWSVWRLAELEDWGRGNDAMLTPESIYRIPDEKLAHLGSPVRLREDAATRLLGVVLEETDMAVVEPGARERAMMKSNSQKGTLRGELTQSFWQFKAFPLAMISRHWERGMSQPNTGGKVRYLATLLASTTVLGMASLQVNEVLMGRDPRNMNPKDMFGDGSGRNWIAAMLKGGSLGLYGDYLFSEASQHGSSPLAAGLGPVAGLVESMLGLTQGNLIQAAQGKDTNVGAELVRFAKANTPGASLWYLKAALDHLIFQKLQEYFSPGYLEKMKRRARKEFNQQYWWEPGETMPDRAPDPNAAMGG